MNVENSLYTNYPKCLVIGGVKLMSWEIGRVLLTLGIVLAVVGGVIMLLGRTGLPLGRLPGDFVYRGKNTTFYFPLATCVLLSIVLSIVLFVIGRLKR